MPLPVYDIVVIGAGLAESVAGLSSVLEAGRARDDFKICLLEKQERLGGNSAKASSGINAIASESDVSDFFQDTIESGHDRSNEDFVKILVNNSESAIKFLENEKIDLSVKSQLGGHRQARTRRNRSGPNIGFAIISALQAAVQGLPNIEVFTSADVIDIQHQDPFTISYNVHGERHQIQARALILATGGFAANSALLSKYQPSIGQLPTTNGQYANGDGIQLATTAFHAGLVDMDQIQVHPTGFVDPADRHSKHKILAPEALRGSGGILVNQHGQRFVNELSTRDVVSSAVFAQPGSHAFLILDQAASEAFGLGTLQFYIKHQLAAKCSSLSEVAGFILKSGDASAETLTDTISAYRQAAADRSDQFGKSTFPSDFQSSEYYVMEVVPVVHYCMGGLKFDSNANVLDEQGKPIAGLFAAGEVTGGLHGGNRLAGNSLLECVVFGRIAARSAISFILNSCKPSSL